MAAPYFRPPRLRGGGSGGPARLSLYAGTPSASADSIFKKKKGLLGLGVGPDLNLGIGTALSELGQGLTGLVDLGVDTGLAAWDRAVGDGRSHEAVGSRWSQLGRGLGSSLAGTVLTLGKLPIEGIDLLTPGTDLEGRIERGVGRALGDEERYKPQDFWEAAHGRGLLPALVENVGNVSLAGGAVTAPVKGAATAARMAGRTERAARLTAVHRGLIERPLIHAAQHPYRTAGSALRERYTSPAASAVEEAAGMTRGVAPVDFLAAELPDTGVNYNRVRVNMERHRRTAEAYKNRPVHDPKAQSAYAAFRDEINEQYRHLTEDLGINVEVVDGDPYRTPDEMVADVRDNKTLKINPTEEGAHPFLTPEENNKFRAVHDAYGHAATGQRFGRHGEEAAFLAHRSMFGDEAGKAMATETRGQNSVLITEGEFPEQKATLLPDDLADPSKAVKRWQRRNPTAPPGAATKFLARIEHQLVSREATRKLAHETRMADMERKIAARSPAVRAAVHAARDHLMAWGEENGRPITRQEASRIIGDELRSRITGLKALEDEFLEKGVPEEAFIRAGIRERFVPVALRSTPEFDAAMVKAVDAQLAESARVREILTSGTKGDKGLTGTATDDAMIPEPTKKQQTMLTLARKRLEKAFSEGQERKIARETASVERKILAAQDRVGRLAEAAAKATREAGEAVAEFEHSRNLTPKAWRGAGAMERSAEAIHARTLEEVAKNGGEWGGASFNPHTGRFIEPGKDTGFAVGLVQDTALIVPLAEFTPQHIEQVIRAYQDVYQHPHTIVGTWVDKGMVYIDPSEIAPTLDDALIRGAARHQLSIFDVFGNTVVEGILKDRPDVAVPFLTRHRNLSARMAELRKISEHADITDTDVAMHMDLLMRRAVAAEDFGLVTHPDEFFRKYVSKFEFAKGRTNRAGALGQIVLNRSVADPAGRGALEADMVKMVDNLDRAMKWYNHSHQAIKTLLGDKPEVTLLDGTRIAADELAFQILAVTSFQASPRDNFGYMMRALSWMSEHDTKRPRAVAQAVDKVARGKMTLDELLEQLAPGQAKKGTGRKESPRLQALKVGVGQVPLSEQALRTLLQGYTLDKWTPEFVAHEFKDAWGVGENVLDDAKALDHVRDNFPEFFERDTRLAAAGDLAEHQALREFYGSALYTKVLSFWDNLSAPDTSQMVTLDVWMARLLGLKDFTKQGVWIEAAEGIRKMAQDLSETLGETVLPHQVQAALWVYAKTEVSRLRVGHFMAYANDAAELIDQGVLFGDDLDPMLGWFKEATAPYAPDAPSGSAVPHDQRIRRGANSLDELEGGETTTETVHYQPEGAKARAKSIAPYLKLRDAWTTRPTSKKGGKPTLSPRERLNAAIAAGDAPQARKILSDFTDRVVRALRDEEGGDFKHIWEDQSYHTKNFVEAFEEAHARGVLNRSLGESLDDGTPLLQAFKDKILGEFVPLDDGTRSVTRIFKDGNFATLVHEDGHALRRMLTQGQMSAVERIYGIKDGVWKVDHEERFANDFVEYLRSGEAPQGLASTFARIKEVISQVWDMVRGTFHQRNVHPELADIFEQWLSPAERPMPEGIAGLPELTETGTLAQRGARAPKLAEPPAKKGDYYQSGRKGAQALARLERLAARQKQIAAAKAKAEAHIEELRTVLNEGRLPAQLERDELVASARTLVDKVNEQMGTPSVKNTPARWQPLWLAVKQLGAEVEQSPDLAGLVLEGLPQTLHEVQQLALSRGFDPAHVRDFSPAQVRRLVYGNMRLGRSGLQEVEAGTRKSRTGALVRAGAVDRSVEAFLAATVEALHEKRTNAVVSYIEDNIAMRLPKGAVIPEGYALWDPVRTFLLTGEELSDDGLRALQTSATHASVVPEAVVRQMHRMTKDFDHWVYRAVGKVTSPWRTLVLTLSPGWYVRNVVGNLMLATTEGASLRDWQAAWRSYRKKDNIGHFADEPWVTSATLAQEAGVMVDDSVIPRQGRKEAVAEAGRIRGTAQHAARRMLRVNEVVDEFARSAVYHNGLRRNMTKEAAWSRASDALVDYNALSPFERHAVRSVIPFYAWQKGILKLTMAQVIDHPARVHLLALMGQVQAEYVADRLGVDPEDVPSYMKHLVGDHNMRSFNPFADPADVISVEGITRSMNPFIELAIRKGLGAPEFYTDQKRLGFFGTAEPDVDVGSELGEIVTRSPGGRIIGEGPGQNLLGLSEVDPVALRSRLLRARQAIRGIPNPETGTGQAGATGPAFLPPRMRRAA